MLRAVSLLGLLCLAACSSAGDATQAAAGASQTIRVDTPGMEGARCVLQNGRAAYTVVTPGSVAVQPHETAMTVTCFKGDYMLGSRTVTPSFAPREAAESRARGRDCATCRYPAAISVAMALNTDVANDITVRQIR